MRKVLWIVLALLAPIGALAQQPQAPTAPIYPVNAKYVQGVGTGYAPTAGSGLTLNLGAGTAFCNGAIATYAGGTLTMTNSVTNYVYLNTASSCVPATSTSAFTATNIPIAVVVASGGVITTITDDRTMFATPNVGSAFGTPPVTPNIIYVACDSVSGGVGTLGFCKPGEGYVTVTGASDTIAAIDRGRGKLYTNGGAVAITVPQAGVGDFDSNFDFFVKTASTTSATLTPTVSQIAGNDGVLHASLSVPASSVAYCYSDNTNYQCTLVLPAGSGSVTSVATTSPITGGTITSTGTIACATCVTSASSLTNNKLMAGAGSQASQVVDLTGDVTTSGGLATTLGSNFKIRDFGTTFGDTGGSALTSGSVVYFTVPYACTIAAWNISVDAGTATLDIWKIATGTAIPTVSNTITASALPAISTGTSIHSTTLTGWTTAVSANDIFGIQLKTVATAKFVEIDIQCNQ